MRYKNTMRPHYKDQAVSVVEGNTRCLLWESHETEIAGAYCKSHETEIAGAYYESHMRQK